jgi:uncharacterized membrane protein YhaH (DUF805 family)
MFCSKCGIEIPNTANFCSGCGARIAGLPPPQGASISKSIPVQQVTFGKAIEICFAKYASFSGRASRPEFWWFYLFTTLLTWGATLVDTSDFVYIILSFALLLPIVAAGARRLHDTGRSGWWQLLALTVLGAIPLVVWLASKGSEQDNRYGVAL